MEGLGGVMIEAMDEQFRQRDALGWALQHTVESAESDQVRLHVRRVGSGPLVLLLHGTGASSHSFNALAAGLAEQAEVIAPDLPGHGLSRCSDQFSMSLPAITNELGNWLATQDIKPSLIVGHSAGAAIAASLATDARFGLSDVPIIALNGAFVPYGGIASRLFGPVARLASSSRLLAASLAKRANDVEAVRRMIRGTGSVLDEAGLRGYQTLFTSADHVRATLRMMANWDLRPLLQTGLPQLSAPLHLLVGELDSAVAPSQAQHIAKLSSQISTTHLGAYGHLMHEENPAAVLDYIVRQPKPEDASSHE